MDRIQTVVVGGGAAGMMAAIRAAELGERVVLLEGNPKLGRKVLISGNGRCNLTNLAADSVAHYHGSNPGFIRTVLEQYSLEQTLAFFRELGIETREEKRQRLFPVSDEAGAVVDVLEDRLQILGVRLEKKCKLASLDKSTFFEAQTLDGQRWQADRVVLASGGVSMAKLGADGSGLKMAEGFGHTCTPLYPGLVPLVSPDKYVGKMQGVRVRAEVSALLSEHRKLRDTDDLLFTNYGVSGFTILNLSAQLVPRLEKGPAELKVNFFPGKVPEQVSEILKHRWETHPHRSLALSFAGLLSRKLVIPLLEKLGFPWEEQVARMTKAQRWHLAQALCAWPVAVEGTRSFDHAEVTIGGIRTDDVNPETLESYLVPGLFFAGEVLDVHGDLGGFNLQWAWSSGWVAGQGGMR